MIRCIAIDDEPFALGVIENYIQQIPFLTLVKKCVDVIDALEVLNKEQIDLIFLDIQMPRLNGINFLKAINTPAAVIFTTAYDKYAIESYDLNVTDYLLKPFSFERFLKAVNKVNEAKKVTSVETLQPETEQDYIFIKTGTQMVKVKMADIICIEGLKDYVLIHTDSQKVIALHTLKSLEEKLNEKHFMRVHKSFIISISKINSVEGNLIKMGKHDVPVGETYKDKFQKILKERTL